MCCGLTEAKTVQEQLEEAKQKAIAFAVENGHDRVVIYQKAGEGWYGHCLPGATLLQYASIIEIETLVV